MVSSLQQEFPSRIRRIVRVFLSTLFGIKLDKKSVFGFKQNQVLSNHGHVGSMVTVHGACSPATVEADTSFGLGDLFY